MSTRIYTQGWFHSVIEPSNSTSVYTQGWFAESTNIPATPSSFGATALSFTDVRLTWVNESSNADGNRILRSTTGDNLWVEIGVTLPSATQFTAPQAIPGVGYDYRLIAFNSEGDSAPAEIIDFATPIPPQIPVSGPPVYEEPVRNTIGPYVVSFIAANVYGLGVSSSGSNVGNKF